MPPFLGHVPEAETPLDWLAFRNAAEPLGARHRHVQAIQALTTAAELEAYDPTTLWPVSIT